MEKHGENKENEIAFSESLEELKRKELESKDEITQAQKRKEEIIQAARNDIVKLISDFEDEQEDEKKKIIQSGLKDIEKEVDSIIDKAQKEADKIRKSASPKKVAEKLLPIVIG